MAKTDVVKHDLTTTLQGAASLNIDEIDEPIPLLTEEKGLEALERILVEPPVTTLVSDDDRVKAPFRSVGKVGVVSSGEKSSEADGSWRGRLSLLPRTVSTYLRAAAGLLR